MNRQESAKTCVFRCRLQQRFAPVVVATEAREFSAHYANKAFVRAGAGLSGGPRRRICVPIYRCARGKMLCVNENRRRGSSITRIAGRKASAEYRKFLNRHGIRASMSREENCWDSSVAESFFSTLKTELVYRESFPTRRAATEAIGEYVDGFYNPIRKHSTIGYMSPVEWETVSSRNDISL